MRQALLVAFALTVASACGDHAASKARPTGTARPSAPPVARAPGPGETTATAVLGSEFRGGVRAREPAAVVAAAHAAFDAAARRFGEVRSIEKASRGDIAGRKAYGANEKLRIDNTYLITLENGSSLSVRLTSGPLGGEIARTVVNTSKEGIVRVARAGESELIEVQVKGRHVIQLDDGMDPANAERAIAREIGEILARRTLAEAKQLVGPDLLQQGPPPDADAKLSPHDRGRLGEIKVLASKVRGGNRSAVHDLLALVEELGLRDGASAAGERRRLITQALGDDAASLQVLDAVWQPETRLEPALRDQLAAVREGRRQYLARTTAAGNAGQPLHVLADARPAPGKTVTPERVHVLEHEAARARARQSAETLHWLRRAAAHLPAGRYPVIRDLQIGGGASLAARDPAALLIDMRARWQDDASERIAQTANQLAGLKAAGIGDPFQFAWPDERVPIAAVRYWEDSIAAQGPVIDGQVTTIEIDERGTTTITISPDDGSPQLRVEVEGNIAIATGLPVERLPGIARGMSPDRAIDRLKAALQRLVDNPASDIAQRRRARNVLDGIAGESGLEGRPRQRERDLAKVRAALDRHRLAAVIQEQEPDAYQAVVAGETWHRLATEHPGKFVLGDMANTQTMDTWATDNWVIGGLGGTGLSAAEIILEKNQHAHVTMIGPGAPDGLLDNDQFTSVLRAHADAVAARKVKALFGIQVSPADGRFSLVFDVTLGIPTVDHRGNVRIVGDGLPPDGIPVGYDARSNPISGARGYISAIGRDSQLPPLAAALRHRLVARGGNMTMMPMYDRDRHYTHYRVFALDAAGQELRHFDVTGAASRFPPWELMAGTPDAIRAAQSDFLAASDLDAPPESGNFDNGLVSSATQASRYARAIAAGDPGFR